MYYECVPKKSCHTIDNSVNLIVLFFLMEFVTRKNKEKLSAWKGCCILNS